MTGDNLDAIFKMAGGKSDKEGWVGLPEACTLTLHVAHDGASMTVSRVDAIKQDGDLVYARNPKREIFALVRSDIFAVALEGEGSPGKSLRRAGFG
jgi:hypothetical protein